MTLKKMGKIGSSFDDLLAGQGILEECEEEAIKQIRADQIKAAMEKPGAEFRPAGASPDRAVHE